MVWGGISVNGVSTLKRIDGIMDKKVYHNILVRQAVPAGLSLIGKGFILQEDNDPKHASKLCRGYLEKRKTKVAISAIFYRPTETHNYFLRYPSSYDLATSKPRSESDRTDLGAIGLDD